MKIGVILGVWVAAVSAVWVQPVSAFEGDVPAQSVYEIDLAVARGDVEVLSSRVALRSGTPGSVSIENASGARDMRVEVLAHPGQPVPSAPGVDTILVSMNISESVDGSWVLVGQPKALVRPGHEASVSVDGPAGGYAVQLKAHQVVSSL